MTVTTFVVSTDQPSTKGGEIPKSPANCGGSKSLMGTAGPGGGDVNGSAANLMVFMAARPGSLIPPLIEAAAGQLSTSAANALPQALVLTAIVIGFALLCFALVLGATLARRGGHDDVDAMQAAEPPATDPLKPPVLEE